MNFYESLILAVALSMDALTVSFSYGSHWCGTKFLNALKFAFAFGFFQFIMPVLGWHFTGLIYSYIKLYSKIIVFLVFLFLGLKFLQEAFSKKIQDEISCISFLCLISLALATSIDAFGAGVSLKLLNSSLISSAGLIGITTFILSFLGFISACYLKKISSKLIEIIGAVLLIYLAFKSLF